MADLVAIWCDVAYQSGQQVELRTVAVWQGKQRMYGRVVGDSALLLAAHRQEVAPFGIFLDRLEECPHEVDGLTSDVVRDAVAWLRLHAPDGDTRIATAEMRRRIETDLA